MEINATVSSRFSSFVTDWDYEQYLLFGGYGSGKSYHIALKIILKLLEEKRTCLVVRAVYETIKESCFSLLKEILENMGLLSDSNRNNKSKVVAVYSPLEIKFPNGSRIIFRGADNPDKLKSINDVSIVWIEECSEIRFDVYMELLGRIRTPNVSLHFILSCNPVGKENWVYTMFFTTQDENGKDKVIQDEQEVYKRRTLIGKNNGVYYHHSLPDDNPFLPNSYISRLDTLYDIDKHLWLVARYGRFGVAGTRVLPNFMVAKDSRVFVKTVCNIPAAYHFFGLDFGFEESYNALISCCVDDKNKILYIYDEVYMNHITDDRFAVLEEVQRTKRRAERCMKPICGDSAKNIYLVLNCVKYWETPKLYNTVA
uniref:Terminase n=1 Tax=Dulem virus 36 TaxID=3145754 RepID=A0AAU8AYP4_9CAUD